MNRSERVCMSSRHPKPDPTKPGQRSVWSFPRPPALEVERRPLRIQFEGETIASTNSGMRVLETSHPPVYFFPPGDVREDFLDGPRGGSACEWKGRAVYFDVVVQGERASDAVFAYPDPVQRFKELQGWYSFYAGPMSACFVGDERVTPQPGGFYSGWITSDVAGPFKGIPGSMGW
ncbi:MAG: DUF427 domain-containing protein [Planctomycetota bacterium]